MESHRTKNIPKKERDHDTKNKKEVSDSNYTSSTHSSRAKHCAINKNSQKIDKFTNKFRVENCANNSKVVKCIKDIHNGNGDTQKCTAGNCTREIQNNKFGSCTSRVHIFTSRIYQRRLLAHRAMNSVPNFWALSSASRGVDCRRTKRTQNSGARNCTITSRVVSSTPKSRAKDSPVNSMPANCTNNSKADNSDLIRRAVSITNHRAENFTPNSRNANSTLKSMAEKSTLTSRAEMSTLNSRVEKFTTSRRAVNLTSSKKTVSSNTNHRADTSTTESKAVNHAFISREKKSTPNSRAENSTLSNGAENSTPNSRTENTTSNSRKENSTLNRRAESSTLSSRADHSTLNGRNENSTPNNRAENSTPNSRNENSTPNSTDVNSTPNCKCISSTLNSRAKNSIFNNRSENSTPNSRTKNSTPSSRVVSSTMNSRSASGSTNDSDGNSIPKCRAVNCTKHLQTYRVVYCQLNKQNSKAISQPRRIQNNQTEVCYNNKKSNNKSKNNTSSIMQSYYKYRNNSYLSSTKKDGIQKLYGLKHQTIAPTFCERQVGKLSHSFHQRVKISQKQELSNVISRQETKGTKSYTSTECTSKKAQKRIISDPTLGRLNIDENHMILDQINASKTTLERKKSKDLKIVQDKIVKSQKGVLKKQEENRELSRVASHNESYNRNSKNLNTEPILRKDLHLQVPGLIKSEHLKPIDAKNLSRDSKKELQDKKFLEDEVARICTIVDLPVVSQFDRKNSLEIFFSPGHTTLEPLKESQCCPVVQVNSESTDSGPQSFLMNVENADDDFLEPLYETNLSDIGGANSDFCLGFLSVPGSGRNFEGRPVC